MNNIINMVIILTYGLTAFMVGMFMRDMIEAAKRMDESEEVEHDAM